ncbi:Uncharacterised protein [Serratia ficaria]|nr:Uncharacterised protein [Serratia ficaria]
MSYYSLAVAKKAARFLEKVNAIDKDTNYETF